MSGEIKKIHEEILEKEIAHDRNEVKKEDARIEAHQKEEKNEKDALLKDLRKAEIHHDEQEVFRASHKLDEHEAKLQSVKLGHPGTEEDCEKAYEFKKLADQAKSERILDEDLFETPIQPLK